ncbi:hypothetical protein CPB84DRAFT_534716 [Gymnopilus junonius]|uniref:DUF6533 domain-containing protein n=1 Tax=Gymnopilus junonius TaxID=109634 RepID=A0A9P5NW56_GYMJU|nr:hypothetical protein CPB84DRAFT_534716 [Gymnopilus junonius]
MDAYLSTGLVSNIKDLRILSYMWLSATVCLILDTLHNLPEEEVHIWRRKRSITKFLYFVTRYWTLGCMVINTIANSTVQMSLEVCNMFLIFASTLGGTTIPSMSVDFNLAFRVVALHSGGTKLKTFLAFLLVVELSLQMYVGLKISKALSKEAFLAPAGLPLPGCLSSASIASSLPAWVVNIGVTGMGYAFCKHQVQLLK